MDYDMKLKHRWLVLLMGTLLLSGTAHAGPRSVVGGKPISSGTAHNVGIGWPSVFYEWWHAGTPEWALAGEIVYGDWSGAFSDVTIGGAFEVPVRWHLSRSGSVDAALRLTPGVLFGEISRPKRFDDRFVCGLRGEFAIPVSIRLDQKVNLITGGTVPFSVLFVESQDPYVVIPILARIGVEIEASKAVTPWLLFEFGPTIAAGDVGSDVDFGFRVWLGTTLW